MKVLSVLHERYCLVPSFEVLSRCKNVKGEIIVGWCRRKQRSYKIRAVTNYCRRGRLPYDGYERNRR